MKRYFFLLSLLYCAFSFVASAGDPDQIIGIWKSSNEDLIVKIDKVGDHFQGRIVWLGSKGGSQPELDERNPNERLKRLPLKGNKIIKELSFNPSASVWGGTYYNYKEGRVYRCQITFHGNDLIKITKFDQSKQDGIAENWIRQ